MGHRPEAPRPSRWGCPLGLLLASSSLSLLALLLLPTPTAAVGAAAASTFVVSKPAGGLESSGGSSSSSSSDPEIDSAEPASSSLASALLPSSAPPSSKSKATQLHLVEVYENERWTALGGWQRPHGEGKVRPWTYEDGGESLDPQVCTSCFYYTPRPVILTVDWPLGSRWTLR